MEKKAFTLIELMISIALISLILIYLFQSTNTIRITNDFYAKKQKEEIESDKLFFTLLIILDLLICSIFFTSIPAISSIEINGVFVITTIA